MSECVCVCVCVCVCGEGGEPGLLRRGVGEGELMDGEEGGEVGGGRGESRVMRWWG